MKIGKIHVIYVYIKNQKQTDELQRSQVGCGLGEVCASGQKVSPLAGSLGVVAMTVEMLLTLVSQTGPIYPKNFHFLTRCK